MSSAREIPITERAGSRAELAGDARFATHADRKEHEGELDELVAAWTRERDPWQVTHLLQARGVMAGVVEDLADMVVRDPHLSTQHLREVARQGESVAFTTHAQPVRLDGVSPELRRASLMGEHNEYVFKQLLGLSDDAYVQALVDEVIY